jgi:hypothetical protein
MHSDLGLKPTGLLPRTMKILRQFAKLARNCLADAVSLWSSPRKVSVFGLEAVKYDAVDLPARLSAYGFGILSLDGHQKPNWWQQLLPSMAPLLVYGHWSSKWSWIRRIRGNVFWVDDELNPLAGWEWCDLALHSFTIMGHSIPDGRSRLNDAINRLRALGFSKCYLFGTGPSLGRALDTDWSDGFRVVCNTIVRDAKLWAHINPHFIVAGDGIYHFGHTDHARAFRRDLAQRLKETDTYFLLPDRFFPMVADELKESLDRVIPISIGTHEAVHRDLTNDFALPCVPNVLNMLLLPLGCTLSKRICLWGFDGRAPADKLFWANSSKQSYQELMEGLRQAHPAFFSHQVPDKNPNKYVQAVHGDLLDRLLSQAEAEGWAFEMLHETWTPTLAKRRPLGQRGEAVIS